MSYAAVWIKWPVCSCSAGNEWPAGALTNLALSGVRETHKKDLINDHKRVTSLLVVNQVMISTLQALLRYLLHSQSISLGIYI